ncbi:hypothetical protein C9374_002559 [Naegleria lovaniensis]|uniref:Calcineurin-like phosphoesterase domain-containing protein n=1 Tax=Naegleria lovaniensis TaxID=51637 RepID=A0AA88GU86_NAELO|nr:uncharacterized protein C9374_002559 [Naegleria lovaniensis]KAG2386113.1 hypothetical protein C9374_002559 [Naegleria lovaniensis]
MQTRRSASVGNEEQQHSSWQQSEHETKSSSSVKTTTIKTEQQYSSDWYPTFRKVFYLALIVLSLFCVYKRLLSTESDAFKTLAIKLDVFVKNMLLLILATSVSWFTVSQLLNQIFPKFGLKEKSTLGTLFIYVLIYLNVAMYLQTFSNMNGRMGTWTWRVLVSYASGFWQMTCMFFTIFMGLFYLPLYFTLATKRIEKFAHILKATLLVIVLVLCLFGLFHTLGQREVMRYTLDVSSSMKSKKQVVKIIPVSDVHLGIYMNVQDLQKLSMEIISLVNEDPENTLILFMGDFFTFESEFNVAYEDAIYEGLKPLSKLHHDKVYVALGNHDYDLIEHVLKQLEKLKFKVLRDESLYLKDKNIQLVGFNFAFKNAEEKTKTVIIQSLQSSLDFNVKLRLLLLHHPSHFQYAASELSEHSSPLHPLPLNLKTGFVNAVLGAPDYAWYSFDQEKNKVMQTHFEENTKFISQDVFTPRLYVVSGSGFYGPPLRIGTINELPYIEIIY